MLLFHVMDIEFTCVHLLHSKVNKAVRKKLPCL
jgi:hypothetical protein